MIDYFYKEAEDAQRAIDQMGVSCRHEPLEVVVSRRQLQHERRGAPRFEMMTKLTATIFAADGRVGADAQDQIRLVRDGFTTDISLSGACIVLKDRLIGITMDQLVGQRIKLRLDFRQEGPDPVHVLGRIVWGRVKNQRATFGVQFTDIPDSERAVLSRYCVEDSGEMNSISDLWEALVLQDNDPWGSNSQ